MFKRILEISILIFGQRIKIWLIFMFFVILLYLILSFFGFFSGWNGRNGPLSIVSLIGINSFLILIPFLHLVYNAKEAVRLKYIGWVYFIYLAIPVLLLVGGAWNFIGKIFSGNFDLFNLLGPIVSGFLFSSFYTMFSVPLAIILVLASSIRKK